MELQETILYSARLPLLVAAVALKELETQLELQVVPEVADQEILAVPEIHLAHLHLKVITAEKG
jgi:hypothetical protein